MRRKCKQEFSLEVWKIPSVRQVTENGIVDSRQLISKLKVATFVANLLLCVNVLAYNIRFYSYPAISWQFFMEYIQIF